jgi:hypothetical protein
MKSRQWRMCNIISVYCRWILCRVRVLDHFWPPNVACYAIEDADQVGNSVYYKLTRSSLQLITIIYHSVTLLHSLQSYTPIFNSWHLHIFTLRNLTANFWLSTHSLRNWTVSAVGLQHNSSARTPRKTLAPLLRIRLLSCCIVVSCHGTDPQKTSHVIVTSLADWRPDCCLATSNNIRNSIVACVYSVARCLSVRCLAIHVTLYICYYWLSS